MLVTDAADNSITAAKRLAPPERSFISDFVTLGGFRDNVRIIVTARTSRMAELQLPSHFKHIPLDGFTRDETGQHVKKTLRNQPELWIDEFHTLSHGNPRVQAYAIQFGRGNPDLTLNFLRPQGKLLEDIFNQQLVEALHKNGSQSAIDDFCAALITLPRPIPWLDLAAVTKLSIEQLRDICFDLAPAIRIADDGIGFADEDFEEFVRSRTQDLKPIASRVAEWFLSRHQTDSYAATHIASSLHQAGRGRELIRILEQEREPSIIGDPFLRRDVQLQRIRIAVMASVELNDTVDALRTILVGAEALKTHAAIGELAVENPDLSVAFMRNSASKMILFDPKQIEHHGPFLFHLLREEVSEKNHIAARDTARLLTAWLSRRQKMIDEEKEGRGGFDRNSWKIEDHDVAAEIESALLWKGPRAAMEAAAGWRPRELGLRVARILIPRLIAEGKANLVEQFIDLALVKEPWNLAFLVPLSIAGRPVDLNQIEKALRVVMRLKYVRTDRLQDLWQNEIRAYWLDIILTSCEIIFARGGNISSCLPLLAAFTDDELRREDGLFSSQSSLISLMLRAHALLQIHAGQQMTADSFLVKRDEEKGQTTTRQALTRSPSDRERIERARELVGSLVPIYSVRSEIISGRLPIGEAGKELSSALGSFQANNWRLSRQIGAHDTRKALALSIASLAIVPDIDLKTVLARSLDVFEEQIAQDGSDEIATLSVLMPNSVLHDDILDTISHRAAAIREMKIAAQQKTNYLLQVVRFLRPLSQADAKVLFGQAHEITREIDTEARNQLRCIGRIAIQARDTISHEDRRSTANDLFAITTDAAIRLDDQRAFPWSEVTEALTALDFGVALAATARWEDTDVVDRESTIPALLKRAVLDKVMSSEDATAFLPLLNLADIELLRTIVRGRGSDESGKGNAVVETIAKAELLRFGRGNRPEVLRLLAEAVSKSGGNTLWLEHLQRTHEFIENLKKPKEGSAAINGLESDSPNIKHIIEEATAGHVWTSRLEEAVTAALQRARKTEKYISLGKVLDYFRAAVAPNDRILYLNSVSQLSTEIISENELAASIFRTIQTWTSPAVQDWCEAQLPKFIVDHFPALAGSLSYERHPPLRRLALFLTKATASGTIIEGIASHVNDLTAANLYESVAIVADNLGSQHAATLFRQYLPRVAKSVPEKDFVPFPLADIPTSHSVAIGRYLHVHLADCDVRTRWRAAHVVRQLGAFDRSHLLSALMDLYDRTAETTFQSSDAPFHWLNARLWAMIALARTAAESPKSLKSCAERLLAVALDEAFPHLLVRKFAKDAVITLAKNQIVIITESQERCLQRIESGHLERKRKKDRLCSRDVASRGREPRFRFDMMDTVPYWYEPATSIFADVSVDEFIDVAEKWIVEKWQASDVSHAWKDQPRRHRYSESDWALWSHSHGSTPTIERYDTHLEWHAMWCAVGELMECRSLTTEDGYDYGSLEERLSRECLTLPPNWLADFRGPKPLEERYWYLQISDEWTASIEDKEFLLEIGVGSVPTESLVMRGRYETTSSEGSSKTSVDSALVQPETAAALVRALQTVDEPMDFALPSDGEDRFEIDETPYRLLGCITRRSESSGIDEGDPLRNQISGMFWRPGCRLGEKFEEQILLDGRVCWANAMSSYTSEQWSDSREDEDDTRGSKPKSNGVRLRVSVHHLKQFLERTGFDLLVSVEVTRRKGRYNDARAREEEGSEARFGRILLLRSDGSLETAEGRIGSWCSPDT
ncbi:MAG TPA: hypothetical protein VIH56_09450 [Candidatus Acidoferrales bacterium]